MTRPRHLALAAVLAATAAAAAHATADPEAVRERLRYRLEANAGQQAVEVAGQLVQCESALRRFYTNRDFAPAWTEDEGISARADTLVALILAAGAEGLTPDDYHLGPLLRMDDHVAAGEDDAPRMVDFELLLTDAWLMLATHFLAGKLDPETLDPEWMASRRQADLAVALERAIQDRGVGEALRALLPHQRGYADLRAAYARYRAMAAAGGWRPVPPGPLLKPGDRDERTPLLAARLAVEDTALAGAVADADDTYGMGLEAAVRAFQRRHGLVADGIVGPTTLAALNEDAATRADQVRVNLERWRWMPQDLGRRHIVVNIADFHLDVIENDTIALTLPVIVGRPYRRTPVFSATMTYLVLSPAWEVPPRLAVQDMLPRIRKDPGYLGEYGFTVLRGWGADERVVEPDTVRWDRLGPRSFPYRLRQAPGPKNALGGVKFMFPNRFAVYLHDTSDRTLFNQPRRTFSSGCIRVKDAEKLAYHLLADDPAWTPEEVASAMAGRVERTVRLPRPLPVHLQYWTAWTDADGAVQFRQDIYDRDGGVATALVEPPPAAGL